MAAKAPSTKLFQHHLELLNCRKISNHSHSKDCLSDFFQEGAEWSPSWKNIKIKRIFEIHWLSIGEPVTTILSSPRPSMRRSCPEKPHYYRPKQATILICLNCPHALGCRSALCEKSPFQGVSIKICQFFSLSAAIAQDCIETLEDLRQSNGLVSWQ